MRSNTTLKWVVAIVAITLLFWIGNTLSQINKRQVEEQTYETVCSHLIDCNG